MAKTCIITNKSSLTAGRYSNRTRATQFNPGVKKGKVRRKANIQRRRIFVPELSRYFVIPVSNHGLKTIRKKGAYLALKDAGVIKV